MSKKIIKMRRRRKNNIKNFFLLLKGIIFLIVILILVHSLSKSIYRSYTKEKEVQNIRNQIDMVKEENRNFKKQIKELEKPEEIEKLAREIGLVKKNEVAFRVISKEKKEEKKEEVKKNSYFDFLKRFLDKK